MNNYTEYKDGNGRSIFVLLNDSDIDILEAQQEITANGYLIIAIGNFSTKGESTTIIHARKVQEDRLKEAEL